MLLSLVAEERAYKQIRLYW